MSPVRIAIVVLLCSAERGYAADESQQVRALLDAAVKAPNREAQQASFQSLEELGCAAVPALARYAGDRRPLPYASISLRNNFPGAFEGIRHYAPTVVGEAAAALLNQITGKHFGAVYNGATAEELEDTASQWQEYVRKTPAGSLCSPPNEHSNKPLQPTRAAQPHGQREPARFGPRC